MEAPTLNDGAFFLSLMTTSGWLRFIGDRGITTESQARQYVQNSLETTAHQPGVGLFVMRLKTDGTPVGICSLVKRESLAHVDIGFAMLVDQEGYGYATEGALATLDYAKNVLKHKTLMGITHPENIASQRILERLGMHRIPQDNPDHKSNPSVVYQIEFDQ